MTTVVSQVVIPIRSGQSPEAAITEFVCKTPYLLNTVVREHLDWYKKYAEAAGQDLLYTEIARLTKDHIPKDRTLTLNSAGGWELR